jgi:hypothetical protein
MFNLLAAIGVPFLKWIFERKAKRALSDKEFFASIEVFNERKKNAGKVAEDWRSTLDAKLKDIEASESQSQKES